MNEWKEKLRLNLNNIAESKKLTDFESVKILFQRKFFALSRECDSGVNEFVSVYNHGDIARYKMHHYDLTLENEGETILIAKGSPGKTVLVGSIMFEDGFSLVEVSQEKHYLCGDYVDGLFKEAFSNLLK